MAYWLIIAKSSSESLSLGSVASFQPSHLHFPWRSASCFFLPLRHLLCCLVTDSATTASLGCNSIIFCCLTLPQCLLLCCSVADSGLCSNSIISGCLTLPRCLRLGCLFAGSTVDYIFCCHYFSSTRRFILLRLCY